MQGGGAEWEGGAAAEVRQPGPVRLLRPDRCQVRRRHGARPVRVRDRESPQQEGAAAGGRPSQLPGLTHRELRSQRQEQQAETPQPRGGC